MEDYDEVMEVELYAQQHREYQPYTKPPVLRHQIQQQQYAERKNANADAEHQQEEKEEEHASPRRAASPFRPGTSSQTSHSAFTRPTTSHGVDTLDDMEDVRRPPMVLSAAANAASHTRTDSIPLHMQLASLTAIQKQMKTVQRMTTQQRYEKKTLDEQRARENRSTEEYQLTRLFPALRWKKPAEIAQLAGVTQVTKKPRARSRSKSPNRHFATIPYEQEQQQQPQQQLHQYQPYPYSQEVQPLAQHHFDPLSPIANFNAMRTAHAAATGRQDQLISLLSPRTQQHRSTSQQQHRHGSTQPISTTTASSSSSSTSRPATSPPQQQHLHPRPFLPCNPTQAREIFSSKTRGPFLEGGDSAMILQQQQQQQKRPSTTMNSSSGSQTARSYKSSTDPSIRSPPVNSMPPFVAAGNMRRAAEMTEVDYFFNSPDHHFKRLELQWTRQQAEVNRAQFVQALHQRQQEERTKLKREHEEMVRNGRSRG